MDQSVVRNGGSNLPMKRGPTTVYPDAPLSKVHDDAQNLVTDFIDHVALADELGVEYAFFTEHQFFQTAAEQSPQPTAHAIATAMETEDIKLGQMGNVLPARDPIRLATKIGFLDVLSEGRALIGIVRGYQPREVETLGQYFEGTIQDQEKNRKVFEEKYEILVKAMTEEAFNYYGDFHTIPPRFTKWHHRQTKEYFEDSVTTQEVDEILDWKEGDRYADSYNRPALAGGSTLKRVSVFPQPVQDPYPQIWQPMTSVRSSQWAARRGINGALLAFPPEVCSQIVDTYYQAAEDAGWPDRRPDVDGKPMRRGWDEEKQRGIMYSNYVFNTDVHDTETFDRWKLGLEQVYSHYTQFGFDELYSEYYDGDTSDYQTGEVFPAEILIDARSAIAGSTEEIIETILEIADEVGYQDLHLSTWFEAGGLTPEEENEQLQYFVEHVRPHLEEEFPSQEPVAADD